ncbi:hypothetical protein Tco_0156996 [Tanacetum coccineum]
MAAAEDVTTTCIPCLRSGQSCRNRCNLRRFFHEDEPQSVANFEQAFHLDTSFSVSSTTFFYLESDCINGHRFPLMKTKRKLVPKSTAATNSAGSGECNVVGQDGYDNVGGNVSPGSQRLRQLSSVPCHDQGLQVSGLPDVGLSVTPKGRCVHQSASASCGDQRLPTSGMPHAISRPSFSHSTDGDNVHTHSAGSGENYHQAAHGVDTDS